VESKIHLSNPGTPVFITGGAGFIGKYICRKLLSENYSVVVFDNFSNSSERDFYKEFGENSNVSVIHGDIRDITALTTALKKSRAQTIIHLAAIVSVQESIKNPDLVFDVNVGGCKVLIEAIGKSGNSTDADKIKLIFSSSAAVYGTLRPPLKEDMPIHDSAWANTWLTSPYAKSKLEAESVFLSSTCPATIFRIFNVFGKGQSLTGGYPAVIPAFIKSLRRGRQITIYGDGLQSRDFIAVEDVAAAFHLALEKPAIQGIYNLACGQETILRQVAFFLEELSEKQIDIEYLPARSGDIKRSWAEIEKIKNELDFHPSITLKEGIGKMLFTE